MLTFNFYTILFTAINLLVLFVLLRLFLFKPVTRIMDQRAEIIQNDLDQAKQEKEAAEQLKADYENQLADAKEESARIVSAARDRGNREYEAILSRAQSDAEQLRTDTRQALDAEREAMLDGVRGEVAQLAMLAAAKISCRSTDGESDRAMLDAFLDEAGDLS